MNAKNVLQILLLVGVVLLGGCDGRVEFVTEEVENSETGERITSLEQRVDRLEGHVTGLKETSYVQSENGQFVMKLNTQTAIVIVAAIAGIVTLLVVWMRLVFTRDRRDGRQAATTGDRGEEKA